MRGRAFGAQRVHVLDALLDERRGADVVADVQPVAVTVNVWAVPKLVTVTVGAAIALLASIANAGMTAAPIKTARFFEPTCIFAPPLAGFSARA